jgi:dynein heavy chain
VGDGAVFVGLCQFHAVMVERKKFGAKGYNMMYPFSTGDLICSASVLRNYMESAPAKVPWADLRYLFGEIMYGGHIVNDFDRLLCVTYLDHVMKDELLDEMELFPYNKDEGVSFMSPSPTSYERYLEHIEEGLRGDTPIAFGLHPNAEIGYRLEQSEMLFALMLELQPRGGGAGGADRDPREEAHESLKELLMQFGDVNSGVEEIGTAMDESGGRGPFQNVLLLELEQMQRLVNEVKRSLEELELGFAGRLTMSDSMDQLETSLVLKRVPQSWARLAWPSQRSLPDWRNDLQRRIFQLNDWSSNPGEILRVTWLSGLINPQSFLTAIRQQTAQAEHEELDKLVIQTEVTKKSADEIDTASRDGAFITGLFLQGARWEVATGVIEKSKPREMNCLLPVINARSVPSDKAETKGIYMCPVYKSEFRGPTYVFSAQLKTKAPPARWIMAGVAVILDVGI